MAKKKSKAKSEKEGDYEYDDTEEGEWVEDEAAAAAPAPSGAQTTEADDAAAAASAESLAATRELPEDDRSVPPVRPEDQEPEPYGSDISPNQAFNVKAGSFPEDRPDHDKPLKDKGKDK